MVTDAPEFASEILVVDDRDQNLTAIEAALVGLGNQLVFASSGAEALRFLLERDFALILLDVQMPGMDGIETARMIRARERSRHVPIIFITAYDSTDEDVLAAYRLNAVDFLFKPVNPDILRAKASVFVELQRRNAEVIRQARLLKEQERETRDRALAEQRRRLEAEALRRSLAEQRRHATELTVKNLELETIRAQLELSNQRLATADRRKDEFIAVLAHELRNPLSGLMSGLEILGCDPPQEARERIRVLMRRQCEHLVRLVDDLLDISRITSGKLELQRREVDVRTVIDDATMLVALKIEQREHTLDVDCQCPDAVIDGDPVRLAQMVANLLSNAARYTDPGGHIRLSARRDPDTRQISFVVKDDGHGMKPEVVERVFDMFVQEHAGGGGLGIGLTLVRQLSEMHGGEVFGRSDGPGKGSEFEIRLPEAGPAPRDEETIELTEDDQSLRISLVHDESNLARLTRSMLDGWGHDVSEAATGEAGVALVLEKRPDVAIIDINLPDIDGFAVARRLRESMGEACPRLISISANGVNREEALAGGFDDHLSKPADASTVRAVMLEASR